MPRPTYTPGPGGYVLMAAVSFVVFCLLGGLVANGAATLLPMAAFLLLHAGVVTCPVLVSGVLLTHFLARHHPRQGMHVLAGATAGLLIGPLGFAVIGLYALLPAALLALSLAVGRAVVIPLVRQTAERLARP